MRRDEVPVTEQLDLRLLAPVRRHLEGMRGRQAETPSDRRMAARDLQHDAIERCEIELIAAEHFRLADAIEPGRDELLVHRGRIGPALVRLVLLRAQFVAQCRGTRDDLFWCKLRLGNRKGGASQLHQRHTALLR